LFEKYSGRAGLETELQEIGYVFEFKFEISVINFRMFLKSLDNGLDLNLPTALRIQLFNEREIITWF
jgi:hypothetical protein